MNGPVVILWVIAGAFMLFSSAFSPNSDMCDWGTGTCVEAQMNPIMTLETLLNWPGMGLITAPRRSTLEHVISHIYMFHVKSLTEEE